MTRAIASLLTVLLLACCAPSQAPDTDLILPEDFVVYRVGNGIVNWPAPGGIPVALPTRNLYRGPGGGYVACYSRDAAHGAYAVGGGIWVMGQIRTRGAYNGRIFHPEPYGNADISTIPALKRLCGEAIPACRDGCWAGGDTGGWFGVP